MKRFLLLAALCLFSVPAKATVVFDLPLNGTVLIMGDFEANPSFTAYIDWNAIIVVGENVPRFIPSGPGAVFMSVLSGIAGPNGPQFYKEFTNVAGGGCRGCYPRANLNPTINFTYEDAPIFLTTYSNISIFSFDNDPSIGSVTINRFQIFLPDGLYILDPQVSAVPEPSTWAMMILGFASLAFMAYRRKARPALMALCTAFGFFVLFSVPAKATTASFTMDAPYVFQTWTLDVLGFVNPLNPFETFHINVGHFGGPTAAMNNDPANQSIAELFIRISGSGGSYMEHRYGCSYSLSHCERGDQVDMLGLYFFAEPQTLTIQLSERISGPLASYGPVELDISFPDNVILGPLPLAPAVPEPATWAMMLIGFALLAYRGISRVKRHPRRIGGQRPALG